MKNRTANKDFETSESIARSIVSGVAPQRKKGMKIKNILCLSAIGIALWFAYNTGVAIRAMDMPGIGSLLIGIVAVAFLLRNFGRVLKAVLLITLIAILFL